MSGWVHEYVVDNADGTWRTGYVIEERAAPVAPVGGPVSNVKAAFVLLDFDGVTPQDNTPDEVRGYLTTVRNYYRELSYGTFTVDADVFGPYRVPRPADCSLETIGALARQTATARGVAIGTYDHVGITLPSANGLDCACGVAWLGRSPAVPDARVEHTSLYTCVESNAFAHELGHAFGLHHASHADCAGAAMRRDVYDACALEEYGNQFNVMGNGLGHMNAFQKGTMKWLNTCNVVRVTSDATFRLRALPVSSAEVQALQIATGDTHDGNALYYYVEYRDPSLAGFNAGGGSPREKGPGLHVDVAQALTDDDGDKRPLLLDLSAANVGDYTDPRLTPGRRFSDPDGRVTIELVSAADGVAEVRVTFPGGGSGDNLCLDGTTPPAPADPVDAGVPPIGEDAGEPVTGGDLTGGCCQTGGGAAPTPGMLTLALLTLVGLARRRR
ncbi:MAG TPA: M12 family metallo-peptidase [Kofleriaceae bacterium]|nr:M12 family metallo-peptidase [Kofleriaceae bacterium]